MTDEAWYSSKECEEITEAGSVAYNRYYCHMPFDACPYAEGTKEADAWDNGWSRQRGH